MLIADTAAEIASLLLVKDIKKQNERRGRWKEMLSGDKRTGENTFCWGKLVKDYRFKSLLFPAFIWCLFIQTCKVIFFHTPGIYTRAHEEVL